MLAITKGSEDRQKKKFFAIKWMYQVTRLRNEKNGRRTRKKKLKYIFRMNEKKTFLLSSPVRFDAAKKSIKKKLPFHLSFWRVASHQKRETTEEKNVQVAIKKSHTKESEMKME